MKTTIAIAGLALALCVAGCNQSQVSERDSNPNTLNNNPTYPQDTTLAPNAQHDEMTPRQASGLERQDRYFAERAAAAGAYEVQAGRLAAARSTDEGIKAIARKLVDDHTKAGDELASLARDKGMVVNATPDADQQKMLDKLNGLTGSEFDHEFLRQQEDAHTTALVLFQEEDRLGKDAALKGFASRTIPVLGEHKKMVQARIAGNSPVVGSDVP